MGYISLYTYTFHSCLLISDLVVTDLAVANLFMHSLPSMILLYLAMSFFIPKVFLHEIHIFTYVHMYTAPYVYGVSNNL